MIERAVAITMGALLCGCASMLPAPTPLRSIEYANAATPAKCLFVLLPGAGDRAETFEQRGFIEEIRSRALSIDIRATDATMGYYMKGTFRERLTADVIEPALARGYEELWLVGPSMGGFGTFLYSRMRPAEVTGVLAIAPFLGDRSLIQEIAAAGGLPKWQAPLPVAQLNEDNYQREIWRWLQSVTQGIEIGPLMFVGYGTSDRLAKADALLTAELPPSRVFLTHGGHDWDAWRRVLESFLDSPEFSTHCR